MSSENDTPLIVNLKGKVSPAVLASLFDCNVSLLYQEGQKGRLPSELTESTYLECIHMYLRHFKKNQDLKLARLEADTKLKEEKLKNDLEFKKRKFSSPSGDSEGDGFAPIHPLVALKMKQDVRLGRAKEEQLLQKTAIERNEFISLEVMQELIEPLIISLRGNLMALADISAENEKIVDDIMDNIYTLGVKLSEDARDDAKEFFKEMMEREIDFDD